MENREGLGQEFSSENKETPGEFAVTFPDGTIGRFKSREAAAEAIREWREAA